MKAESFLAAAAIVGLGILLLRKKPKGLGATISISALPATVIAPSTGNPIGVTVTNTSTRLGKPFGTILGVWCGVALPGYPKWLYETRDIEFGPEERKVVQFTFDVPDMPDGNGSALAAVLTPDHSRTLATTQAAVFSIKSAAPVYGATIEW